MSTIDPHKLKLIFTDAIKFVDGENDGWMKEI